jgi:hypothetical protein
MVEDREKMEWVSEIITDLSDHVVNKEKPKT